MASTGKVVIAYWAIRGLAQPIRLLLEYAGADYEDKKYTQGDGPEYSRQEWLDDKEKLGLDFPNLPYFIDGNLRITQSNAILRHLARKHNLYGKTHEDQARIDMLLDQAMDLRNAFVRVIYGSNFDQNVVQHLSQTAPRFFASFEKYLGDKNFFLGSEVTVADFHLYEMFDQHRLLEPTSLDAFPHISAFVKRFAALPKIAQYLASDRCIVHPVNNKTGAWK
eukprot:TRINITY_DN1235_c0_g1_i1.p1 TRINITY_DN1235_c0_g1~~TRINITY_DN1235_c0_g1_i1.p1  ORF type:complete len:253 (+),score=66.79 TRINITY_DN1235_c0_g1_i1:94-759(+)